VPEAVKQKAGPGVAGLVAQDGAAGMGGDDSGGAHQAQVGRLGFPVPDGGVVHGQRQGEGQRAWGTVRQ